MVLPQRIRDIVGDAPYQTDCVGLSGSGVLIYPEMVLKIQPQSMMTERERLMFVWLQGKLPVPKLLAYEVVDGTTYLLMSRIPGEMACAEPYMLHPREQSKLLAEAIRRMWRVDPAGCPVVNTVADKLTQARQRVELGLVDADIAQQNGFDTPQQMLAWLCDHQPEEELVFSHGDFCLPNVFFDGASLSGYIDLGQSGLADKWYDIALCHNSLIGNFTGRFGKSYPGLDEMQLFRDLGIEPDWKKIRWHLLLDELF